MVNKDEYWKFTSHINYIMHA